MKKRLLSALLALVMVLAMLPATAFAGPADNPDAPVDGPTDTTPTNPTTPTTPDADNPPSNNALTPPASVPAAQGISVPADEEGKWTVTYETRVDADKGITIADIPCYVARSPKQNDATKKYDYQIVDSGLIYGGKYYSALRYLPNNANSTLTNNITVIGDIGGAIPDRTTSAVFEIWSGQLGITNLNNLTSLTVKNTRNTVKPTVTINGIGSSKLTSLTLERVTSTSTIKENTPATSAARSVTLTDAVFGEISMKGDGVLDGKNVNANRTVKATRSTTSAITLSGGTASGVTFVDSNTGTTPGAIKVHSDGGKIDISGNSTVGDIEIGTLNAKKNLPTVTIGGTAQVGNIGIQADDPSATTATANITINGAGVGVDQIKFDSANVTISAGKVNGVTLNKGGKLALTGSYITVNGANLGGASQLTVAGSYNAANSNSGSHNTIGNMYVQPNNTVSLTIPNDPTNTFGGTSSNLSNYTKKNIMGGTWKFDVPASALSSTLVYKLVSDITAGATDVTYTYYTSAQLGAALNKQYETSAKSSLRVTTQTYDGTVGQVRFMNGTTLWGKLDVVEPMQIILPDTINNVKLSSWIDVSQDKPHTYTLPSIYTVPAIADMTGSDGGTPYVELNASGGVNTGDVTKLTKVSASATGNNVAGSVRADLNGNVINLSGAVNAGTSQITLTLVTDAVEKGTGTDAGKDVPVTLDVDVIYFSGNKSLTFVNKTLKKGMTLETDSTGLGILRLSNGTKYTLNGSGLKERSNIKVANFDTGVDYPKTGYSYIEVNVTAPTLKTDLDKKTVMDMFTSFDWQHSPAMKQAINAALSTITQQQVDNWLSQVQREAWTRVNTGTYNAAANANESGYNEVWLVPYLQVTVTGYSTNGTMTFTAVPSWRVEVRTDSTVEAYQNAFFDAKKPENNLTNPKSAKVVSAGKTLGALTGNMGEDDTNPGVTLTITHYFTGTWLHQDNTYAYVSTSGTATTITHAGNNGLGTLVINKDEPLVKLYGGQANGVPVGNVLAYYDSLQAAVDDAEDQQYIVVDQNYKGSMNINVTGTARTFYIQGNGNNVVAANTSNGLVKLNSTGGLYTVQLTRDATAVGATTADIAVASGVTNGTVTLSTTRARANTDVNVTTTPAAGYLTRNLTATARTSDNRNVTVAVTKTSDNHYTFKVPTGATSITVTPTFAIDTGMPFTDVDASDPYFEAVKYVYEHNPQLMNGMTATSFGGYGTITRGQVVTILYRLSGSPSVSSYSGFTDVNTSKYYAAPITWAKSNGIVDGYGTTFGPEDAITREQLAKILRDYSAYRGLNVSKTTSLSGYTDAGSVHSWALEGMQWSVANGIVGGTTTTTLSPGNSAQRYHAATMLMRYCRQYGL